MPNTLPLPTPSEIIAHLDRFVRGQARAKQDLAVAVYNHYLSQAYREREGQDLGRHHVLMIGPTGVGKTYLVRTLAQFLGVPVGFASAAGLVEAGYKGNSVETIVASLLDRAEGDPRKAEKGIVFLDEVDKIRRQDGGGTRDVSGEGVQNALLTLLDGRLSQGLEGRGHRPVDSARLLFICTGAFVGLSEMVEQRLGKTARRIGFQPKQAERVANLEIPDRPLYELLCQAETQDLVQFGLIPEFIGRFATITVLHELSQKDLRGILGEGTEQSALDRQAALARVHGIELVFTDAALDALAEQAMALGTGARGLDRLLGVALDAVDHRWPELAAEGIARVVFEADSVSAGAAPRLEKGSQGARQDAALREQALAPLPRRPRPDKAVTLEPSETSADREVPQDDAAIREQIAAIKREALAWEETVGSARAWWETFEEENAHRPALILRLVEELQAREATISEFFLAYVYSNTDNIQANLHYLDYKRLKDREEDDE